MRVVLEIVLAGLKRGKARFLCAVVGIAAATGAIVFMTSLVATNAAQAPFAAQSAAIPWAAWRTVDDGGGAPRGAPRGAPDRKAPAAKMAPAKCDLALNAVPLSVDYRPGGRVLQGPPMRVFLAAAPAQNPYGAVRLAEGRWPDAAAAGCEVVAVRSALRRFSREPEPALGSEVKFVGRATTMTAKVVGYLDGGRLPREFPNVFANPSAFAALAVEHQVRVELFRDAPAPADALTPRSEQVVAAFRGDEQRRMDYAKPLLVIAAFLTALALLVNSLLLAVEANRPALARLRAVGMTRSGVVACVGAEAALTVLDGWVLGVLASVAALHVYVHFAAAAFPSGVALDCGRIFLTLAAMPFVAALALAAALAPALRVRGMDAAFRVPRRRRRGMAIAYGCGFAAFVAVEVWGASLMRGFVPSPEWPDAIVSLLPGGVSSFEVEKLRGIEGVKRISELVPRQLEIAGAKPRPVMGGRLAAPNVLFLAAEFLPDFRFVEGDREGAAKAVAEGRAVVIAEMLSRAHGLHVGDELKVVAAGRRGAPGRELSFPVAGVVDLNWHMVTSRGLVRGLNGASPMTDGPAFCSFDTMGEIDPRTYMTEPAMSAPMTHLWVEYEPGFLARHGVFPAGRLVEAEIARRLGNPVQATVRLHARDEIADGTLAHGSDLIGQAARVPFVFLAILAIGFVAMLVAEADARKDEFAALRAAGATLGQVAWALARTAVRTAFAGIAVGLPLGAAAGWYASFGTAGHWPGMPHHFAIPWAVVIEGAAGAVVFALVIAVPTAAWIVGGARRRAGRGKA